VAEQIEAERRATEKYKADLESKVQRERALAEAEGRIRENRENEDVNRRSGVGSVSG
jgi:ATPase family AAA domain-containing protein 3A/B